MAKKCLLINGSNRGAAGNSGRMLTRFKSTGVKFKFREIDLVDLPSLEDALADLAWADVLVFATGTYWDSWGWPLQRFLESVTDTEGTSLWLGKPVAVLVTMHSVGGKSVLSRLQGVLNTFGAMVPPMTGIVISEVGQAFLDVGDEDDSECEIVNSGMAEDLWQIEDLAVVAENLRCAADGRTNYRAWGVDQAEYRRDWLEE